MYVMIFNKRTKSLLTYLLTYLLTFLLTYFLSYLLTYLLTYLPTYLLTYSLTYFLTYFLTYLFFITSMGPLQLIKIENFARHPKLSVPVKCDALHSEIRNRISLRPFNQQSCNIH